MRKTNFTISECVCPKCGGRFPIPRKRGEQRERNHQKDIYCINCKEIVTMTEIREGDYD